MNLRNTETAYGLISKLFHWTTVLMVSLAIPLGISLERMQGKQAVIVTTMHQSWGLLILCLILLRLCWRLINIRPVILGENPAWMNRAAHLVHWLAYVLMVLQATAGLLMSQARGDALILAQRWEVPMLVAKSEAVHNFWLQVHQTTWVLLLALIVGHAAAALHHHFGARDATLKRMWF